MGNPDTAQTILDQSGIAYVALYAGETERDGWKCDAWKVALTKTGVGSLAGESVTFDYFTGLGLRSEPIGVHGYGDIKKHPLNPRSLAYAEVEKLRKPIAPSADSVLSALGSDALGSEQTFDDWADEYGYDSDSRKALAMYLTCQDTATKLRKIGLRDFATLAELA